MILQIHHAQITIPKGAEDEARKFTATCSGFQRSQSLMSSLAAADFGLMSAIDSFTSGQRTVSNEARRKHMSPISWMIWKEHVDV